MTHGDVTRESQDPVPSRPDPTRIYGSGLVVEGSIQCQIVTYVSREERDRLELMMLDQRQIERLAAAAAALRPDWPVRSLQTLITRDHTHRAYQDVAVALAWIATDPTSKTPKRMSEHGPWWIAAQAGSGGTGTLDAVRYERCPIDGHTSYRADNCGACKADRVAVQGEPTHQDERTPPVPTERLPAVIRQVLAAERGDRP